MAFKNKNRKLNGGLMCVRLKSMNKCFQKKETTYLLNQLENIDKISLLLPATHRPSHPLSWNPHEKIDNFFIYFMHPIASHHHQIVKY